MKKLIIASDSFKGTISSAEICDIAKRATADFFPDCEVVTIPIADGGEGTVDCFVRAANARPVTVTVSGPLGDPVDAVYCVSGTTAVIEMAAAAGLPLIQDRKDPLRATTYGVGQMMLDAIRQGCRSILLGLGGSATNDAGCGMAAALGAVFRDENGKEFLPTGGTLADIADFDLSGCRANLEGVSLTAMCDVNNPLYGETGAAFIYGPQKGADPGTVRLLDDGLRRLAVLLDREREGVSSMPGAGAAGGCGAGCVAFLNGILKSGTESILDAVDFDAALQGADLVITGEGKLDSQSLQGKLLSGVSARTKAAGVPLVAIVGMIEDGTGVLYDQGLTAVFQTNRSGLPFSEIPPRAASDYEATFRDVLALLKTAERTNYHT